ncbi:helix-turn-helix domain-containing protein [Enterococcus sp. BWR-S5]|uniref:helix-turn-helix domain-containing protein n=1 Tax=Enterococcus sp. BWR-S5 TaxID=2787714 RepID=UPI001924AD2A|nr:helix-turn-helix transcriptional regulator [Enterococcus sp. BWR-S5]MBL1227222.1 helix-turn-helix transcriptional regulator [Enterococcus sp. BWR-S5]
MNKPGDILKKFRLLRNFNQTVLSKGIISRPAYSKIENNWQEPNYEILTALLARLNYEITDFWRELNRDNVVDQCYKLFLKGLEGDLTEQEARNLIQVLEDSKFLSNRHYHLYGMTKSYLHNSFPSIISSLEDSDKEYFRTYINSLKNSYSLYDLKIIGDFATHVLPYSEIKKLYNRLPEFSPYDYAEDTQLYRTQIHKIYNNICDIAVLENDLELASELLVKHKKFAKVHSDLRYLLYIQINEAMILFKKSGNICDLDKLKEVAKIFNQIGDIKTSEAVLYQYNSYVGEDTYKPDSAITHDF